MNLVIPIRIVSHTVSSQVSDTISDSDRTLITTEKHLGASEYRTLITTEKHLGASESMFNQSEIVLTRKSIKSPLTPNASTEIAQENIQILTVRIMPAVNHSV